MAHAYILTFDDRYLKFGGGFTFIACLVIFKLIGPVLSPLLASSYSLLRTRDKKEWNNRLISNFNAILSILLSAYTLVFEDGMRYDDVWYNSKAARLACGLMTGYVVADAVVMLVWCRDTMTRGEIFGFLFHHLATAYAYIFISGYGVLCYFGMLRLIAEASTPAINQRWYFDVLGKKRSDLPVILNGLVMLLAFFFFRMVTLPIYWYQIWLVTNTEQVQALGHIQLIMYIPCLVLDTLNIVWFSKICRGFYKAVRRLWRVSQRND